MSEENPKCGGCHYWVKANGYVYGPNSDLGSCPKRKGEVMYLSKACKEYLWMLDHPPVKAEMEAYRKKQDAQRDTLITELRRQAVAIVVQYIEPELAATIVDELIPVLWRKPQ